jgi:uncharacterized protein (DUF58 family)
MQFADLREYYLGDDIRHIDWKVTARTQSAHIKKFEEERELNVYFAVDFSGSLQFGPEGRTKKDILAEVCALLAFAAVKNNDKVGLIIFTDQIERHIPPKKGRAHAMRMVTELLYFQPNSRGTNLSAALEYCAKVAKAKGVVFVASDFYGDSYDKNLRKLTTRHDVIGLRIIDKTEKNLPILGYMDLQDSETRERTWINSRSYSFKSAFKKQADQFENELNQKFLQAGAEKIDLWTNEDCLKKVIQFFTLKQGRRRR